MLPSPSSLKNSGNFETGFACRARQNSLFSNHCRTSSSASGRDSEQRSFTMVTSCRSFLMVEASK